MAEPQQPLGPYKLVSVNTAPERARRMIAKLCNDVKDKYTIIHEANAERKVTSSANGLRDHGMLNYRWQELRMSVKLFKGFNLTYW